MNNLARRVESALRNLSTRLWLPELTAQLVEAGWRDLYCTAGLSPDTYGTARAIAHDPSAPRRIITRLPVFSGGGEPVGEFQVEALDEVFANGYEKSGVNFYSAQELVAMNVLEQLREAITVLKPIPTLLTTVVPMVRTIHVIDPGDDDYDISFSEPHLPFSIFVSIPRESDVINPLRVAEAIVHEAMHLQLTFIERALPLVKLTSQQYYSPWREEFRNARGVLHGLYVFSVIGQFLRELQTLNSSDSEIASYINKRLSEIHSQINCIRSFQESKDLTKIGAEFTRQIIAGFNSN